MSPLLFLLKLAWDCRYRIPLLITLGFMALDIRLQFELNVQTRQLRRVSNTPDINPSLFNPNQNNPSEPEATVSDDGWVNEVVTNTAEYEQFDSILPNASETTGRQRNNDISNIMRANLDTITIL